MKKILFIPMILCYCTLIAQNVGIGTAKPMSKLHVAGDLRVDAMAGKDSGIVIYNDEGVIKPIPFSGNKNQFLGGDGAFHSANVLAETGSWLLTGNAGTDTAVNFIGTTDNMPLRFRVNNVLAGEINGSPNVSLGMFSMLHNKGNVNVAIGTSTLRFNTTGSANTALGSSTLISNTTGSYNTALGLFALGFSTTGSYNTAAGANALANNHTGNYNVSIGYVSSYSSNTSSYNVTIGYGAMYSNREGSQNVGIGTLALARSNGSGNTAVGYKALGNNLASDMTAFGYESLYSNTTGTGNTATGYRALKDNTVGIGNTATGFHSLLRNSTGNYNTSAGYQNLIANTRGSYNSGYGYKTLFSNTTGHHNTGIGFKALELTTIGFNNTAIGTDALSNNVTGKNNTAVGVSADVTSGEISNATAIGYNAKVNASNKVRIGNSAVTKIEGQVPFSTPSDGRYKYNVREDVAGINFIMQLRPVTYQFDVARFDRYNNQSENGILTASYVAASSIRRTGLIAQEVEIAAKATGYNFSGINRPQTKTDHYSLSYEAFVVPLIKGMQEQQHMIEYLQDQVKKMRQQLTEQQKLIEQFRQSSN